MHESITKEASQSPKIIKHRDTVSLKPEHLGKLNHWIKQLTDGKCGIRVTRNDLIWWMIDLQPAILPSNDIGKLRTKFYDEEKFLRETLRAMRQCRKDGRPFDLKGMLVEKRKQKPKPPKQSSAKKDL